VHERRGRMRRGVLVEAVGAQDERGGLAATARRGGARARPADRRRRAGRAAPARWTPTAWSTASSFLRRPHRARRPRCRLPRRRWRGPRRSCREHRRGLGRARQDVAGAVADVGVAALRATMRRKRSSAVPSSSARAIRSAPAAESRAAPASTSISAPSATVSARVSAGPRRAARRSTRVPRWRCRRDPDRLVHAREQRDGALARVLRCEMVRARSRASPSVFMNAPEPTLQSSTRPSMPSRASSTDRRRDELYALRDVTRRSSDPAHRVVDHVEEAREGIDGLVLDCKVGSGAFMKTLGDARDLARTIVGIGKSAGKRTVALLTRMDEPIGSRRQRQRGTRVDRRAARRRPADTRALTVALGARCWCWRARRATRRGRRAYRRALDDGTALERFRRIVAAQGGNSDVCDRPGDVLPRAPETTSVLAGKSGVVVAIDAEAVGNAVVLLGGGGARRRTRSTTRSASARWRGSASPSTSVSRSRSCTTAAAPVAAEAAALVCAPTASTSTPRRMRPRRSCTRSFPSGTLTERFRAGTQIDPARRLRHRPGLEYPDMAHTKDRHPPAATVSFTLNEQLDIAAESSVPTWASAADRRPRTRLGPGRVRGSPRGRGRHRLRRHPRFPLSTVSGHAGRLVVGSRGVTAPRCRAGCTLRGPGHAQRGLPAARAHPPGHQDFVITNAAGGVNAAYTPGDLVLISDQSTSCPSTRCAATTRALGRASDMTDAYAPELRALARVVARHQGLAAHEGVYCACRDRRTRRREVRMARTLGADLVACRRCPRSSPCATWRAVLGILVCHNLAGASRTSRSRTKK